MINYSFNDYVNGVVDEVSSSLQPRDLTPKFLNSLSDHVFSFLTARSIPQVQSQKPCDFGGCVDQLVVKFQEAFPVYAPTFHDQLFYHGD